MLPRRRLRTAAPLAAASLALVAEPLTTRDPRPAAAPVMALLALATVDLLWTMAHLARGVPEANPLLAWAFACGGLAGFAAVKLALTLPAVGVLWWQAQSLWTRRLVRIALLAYLGVLVVHAATECALARSM